MTSPDLLWYLWGNCNVPNLFFKKNGPTPTSFLFIFGLFKQTLQIFTTNICEKCPSSIRCRDSNPRPLERESPPITTRPGLPPYLIFCFYAHRNDCGWMGYQKPISCDNFRVRLLLYSDWSELYTWLETSNHVALPISEKDNYSALKFLYDRYRLLEPIKNCYTNCAPTLVVKLVWQINFHSFVRILLIIPLICDFLEQIRPCPVQLLSRPRLSLSLTLYLR